MRFVSSCIDDGQNIDEQYIRNDTCVLAVINEDKK